MTRPTTATPVSAPEQASPAREAKAAPLFRLAHAETRIRRGNATPIAQAADPGRALLGASSVLDPATAKTVALSLVKLFPCGELLSKFLRALRCPFGSIGFAPTDDIDYASVSSWLSPGTAAVGLGSSLTGGDMSGGALGTQACGVLAQVVR